MLTGRPAQATAKTLSPVTIYELSKEDLTTVIEARSEVSSELCRALARRQAAGKLLASTEIDNSVPPISTARSPANPVLESGLHQANWNRGVRQRHRNSRISALRWRKRA
jgi:hypothetical protein